MSGPSIVAHEKHGSLLPDPVSTCVRVLGGCAACPVPVCSCVGDRGGTEVPGGLCYESVF